MALNLQLPRKINKIDRHNNGGVHQVRAFVWLGNWRKDDALTPVQRVVIWLLPFSID
ncbi:hypothetical protein [Microbulbifer sp. SSSA005]|uniref:hypothetical protein n=1 Tax=unclassified Microbulbifer TaxID=2619833 RepID=UPI00403A3A29